MSNIEHRGVDRRQIKHLSPNQFELQYLNLDSLTTALAHLNERWGLGSIKEINWATRKLTRSLDAPGKEFTFRYSFNTFMRGNFHRATVYLYGRQITIGIRVPDSAYDNVFPKEQKEQV